MRYKRLVLLLLICFEYEIKAQQCKPLLKKAIDRMYQDTAKSTHVNVKAECSGESFCSSYSGSKNLSDSEVLIFIKNVPKSCDCNFGMIYSSSRQSI